MADLHHCVMNIAVLRVVLGPVGINRAGGGGWTPFQFFLIISEKRVDFGF